MTTGTEGKVWRVGSLGDDTPAVVNGVLGASLRLLLVVLASVPSVGVPNLRVDEVRVELRRESRRRHQCVRGRDDVVGAIGDKRLLDLAHDGVDGSVKTEGLLDDLSVQSQLGEIFVGERREILPNSRLLLLEKLFNKTGVLGQTEEDPGDGGGRRVLTSHKERNHDTSDLMLRNLCAVLVLALQQMPDHVVLAFLPHRLAIPASANNIRVKLDHSLACVVTRTVVGKRSPGQHEVDGRETHVEIVVQLGELGIEGVADLLTLEGAGGSVDCELSHDLGHIERALLTLEDLVASDEVLGLLGNDGNVRAEGVLGETELDELRIVLALAA